MVESILHQATNVFKEFAVENFKVNIFILKGRCPLFFLSNTKIKRRYLLKNVKT